MATNNQGGLGLEEALAPWFEAWQPCEPGEQDRTQTSHELLTMVQRFVPMEVDQVDLVQLLRDKGYKYALIGDDLRWLLKERRPE